MISSIFQVTLKQYFLPANLTRSPTLIAVYIGSWHLSVIFVTSVCEHAFGWRGMWLVRWCWCLVVSDPARARRPERERETLRDSGCLLVPIIVASMGGTATGPRALEYGCQLPLGSGSKHGQQQPGTVARAMVNLNFSTLLHCSRLAGSSSWKTSKGQPDKTTGRGDKLYQRY